MFVEKGHFKNSKSFVHQNISHRRVFTPIIPFIPLCTTMYKMDRGMIVLQFTLTLMVEWHGIENLTQLDDQSAELFMSCLMLLSDQQRDTFPKSLFEHFLPETREIEPQ